MDRSWEAWLRALIAPVTGAYSDSRSSRSATPEPAVVPNRDRIAPGCTVITWMPNGASSMRSESESACTAALLAQYAPANGVTRIPETLPTFTMRPKPRSTIPGSTAWISARIANTFVSNCSRSSSTGSSGSGPIAP